MTEQAGPPKELWPGDLTLICERLAARLATQGHQHPVAAAVMLAARGHTGLTQPEFSQRYQLSVADLQRAEAGDTPWDQLPDVAGALLDTFTNVDLLALADLSATHQRPPHAAEGPS